MRWALKVTSVLAIPAMIVGALVFGAALPDFYMVAFGGIQPGEPLSPENLAPTLGESGAELAIGGTILLAAIGIRIIIRKRLRDGVAGEVSPNKSLERTRGE